MAITDLKRVVVPAVSILHQQDICHVLTDILVQEGIAPAIFTIALGNYVIPSVAIYLLQALADNCFIRLTIDVALIVLAVLLPGWFSGAYIIFVANFINIIGIVFATAWAINQRTKIRRVVNFNAGAHARTTRTTIQFPVASIADAFSMDDPPVAGPLLSSSSVLPTSGVFSRGCSTDSSPPTTHV
jgi:hypothetical protein